MFFADTPDQTKQNEWMPLIVHVATIKETYLICAGSLDREVCPGESKSYLSLAIHKQ